MRGSLLVAVLITGFVTAAGGQASAQQRQMESPSIADEENQMPQTELPMPRVYPVPHAHVQTVPPAPQPGPSASRTHAKPQPGHSATASNTPAAAPEPQPQPEPPAYTGPGAAPMYPVTAAPDPAPEQPVPSSKKHAAAPKSQPASSSSNSQAAASAAPAPPAPRPPRPANRNTAVSAVQPSPGLNADDQFAPSQISQPMPAAVAQPGFAPRADQHRETHVASANSAEPVPGYPSRGASLHAVSCGGPFAKDSSNLALATTFDSRNVTFTDVDGGAVGQVEASVLFPKDPKRRLEVWWSNPASRTDIYLIVINGQSGWGGPGGLHLGLTVAELEKLNHKPFKIKGFDPNKITSVSDWDGGALSSFTGGCKVGITLRADSKAPEDAVTALSADHEYSSADPAIRALKSRVSEILIGY